MPVPESFPVVFMKAVDAIDTGDLSGLKRVVREHPELLDTALPTGEEGYFTNPYLIFFVAGNPVRREKLPENLVEIVEFLVRQLEEKRISSSKNQLDRTLELVATGRTVKEAGLQLQLMDLLLGSGASALNALPALANENSAAALRLIESGAPRNLPVSAGLGSENDVESLLETSTAGEKTTALCVAAFYGRPEIVKKLLHAGADPNAYPPSTGFHSHGTALHHAVASGSRECVQLLVEAKANTGMQDRVYHGKPLDWALYLESESAGDLVRQSKFREIAEWLKDKPIRPPLPY